MHFHSQNTHFQILSRQKKGACPVQAAIIIITIMIITEEK